MREIKLSDALRLLRQTAPVHLFRAAFCAAIVVAIVAATIVAGGLGWIFHAQAPAEQRSAAAGNWAMICFLLTILAFYGLRMYGLYLSRTARLAVMVAAIDGDDIPKGRAQIGLGARRTQGRFAKAGRLFAIDRKCRAVLRQIVGLVQGLAADVDVIVLRDRPSWSSAVLRRTAGYFSEAIVAHVLRSEAPGPAESARTGLVFLAQNARPLLVTGVRVILALWILTPLLFLMLLGPATSVAGWVPGFSNSIGICALAVLFTWAIRESFFEPVALAIGLQAYVRLSDAEVPNPDWEAKLDASCAPFRDLATLDADATTEQPASALADRNTPAADPTQSG